MPRVTRLSFHPNAPFSSVRGGSMMPAAMLMELAKIWTVAKMVITIQL
jgi:hypothetical protein